MADCGPSCSDDGVHSTNITFQVGAQVQYLYMYVCYHAGPPLVGSLLTERKVWVPQALLNLIPNFIHEGKHFNGTQIPHECITAVTVRCEPLFTIMFRVQR